MICVECGTEAAGLVHGSCPGCFTKKTRLIDIAEVLDVEVCAHCDARHVGAHWIDPEEGAPLSWTREDAVRAAAKVHAEVTSPDLHWSEVPEDEKHFRTTLRVEGQVEGVAVADEVQVLVRVRRGVCERCSRMQGGYYSALIQLRATDRDITDEERQNAHRIVMQELERQRLGGNRMSFLAKDETVRGGHDYYVGDIEATRAASRVLRDRLGAQVIESAKLVGRREGDDVYRVTFLVRIRLFAPGDFASVGDRVVTVHSIDRGHAIVTDLATHKRDRVPETSLQRIGGAERVREAVLVSQDPADLQVLDPVDHRTKDVPRPQGYEAAGDHVPVVRYEERLYLVPRPTNNP